MIAAAPRTSRSLQGSSFYTQQSLNTLPPFSNRKVTGCVTDFHGVPQASTTIATRLVHRNQPLVVRVTRARSITMICVQRWATRIAPKGDL